MELKKITDESTGQGPATAGSQANVRPEKTSSRVARNSFSFDGVDEFMDMTPRKLAPEGLRVKVKRSHID
ncbi:MAG: hypothetical protein V4773_13730 [Verrucomicrobiota bacterium]